MDRTKGIIIFTKNRPQKLSKTLPQIVNVDLPVIVLDDSGDSKSKQVVKSISKRSENIHYHGKIEQWMILQKLENTNAFGPFIKPLGSDGWTLGYARNYAIILGKIFGFEQVLFMDDDIIIEDINIIFRMFDILNNGDFVSAEIKGMPDLSVVDFVMQEIGLEPYRFMFGGFLAFSLGSVSEYFLNYYNEDWIWLFLHKPKAKLVKYGEVYQLPYDPFKNAVEKALQQEFGEILVEGVKKSIENGNNTALLLNKDFWNEVIKARTSLIKCIKNLSHENNFSTGGSICKHLLNYHLKINGEEIANIFTIYFQRRKLWCHLLYSIDHIGRCATWVSSTK